MKQTRMSLASWVVGLGLLAWCGGSAAAEESIRIPVETVADYIHAVIEADRTFYTLQIVERLQREGVVVSSEHWRVNKTLPLPAQFLKESNELTALTSTKFQYRLIGLLPINPQNGPKSEFEKTGLEHVVSHPERPYSGIVSIGEQWVFQTIYADRAVSKTCIPHKAGICTPMVVLHASGINSPA
jgi:hypothetical protein